MHFGAKLLNARYGPWAAYYLDYAQLKSLLKEDTENWLNRIQNHLDHKTPGPGDFGQYPYSHPNNPTLAQAASRNVSNSSLSAVSMTHWSLQGLPSFITCLNEEVERILFFFLQEQARVAAELEMCRQDQSMLQQQDSSFWMLSPAANERTNKSNSNSIHGTFVSLEKGSEQNSENLSLLSNEEELLYQKYCHTAMHLLRLIQYVDLNITGIRKILKKHDKLCHTNLSTLYVGKRSTVLAPLLSNDSLDALTKILECSWHEWTQFCKERRKMMNDIKRDTVVEADPSLYRSTTSRPTVSFEAVHDSAGEDTSHQQEDPEPTPTSHSQRSYGSAETTPLLHQNAPNKSSWIKDTGLESPPQKSPHQQELRQQFVEKETLVKAFDGRRSPSPTSFSNGLPVPCYSTGEIPTEDCNQYLVGKSPKVILLHIKAARSRLQETSDFVKMLAAPILLEGGPMESNEFDDEDEDRTFSDDGQDPATREAKKLQRRIQSISDYLNLLSTFLYMANYYIVAPASHTYAEKLGGDASQAGLIIGMTPVAALLSTLLYSWWTSYSYKAALVFASVSSIAGNACYAAGLPFQSFRLVLVGRLLNGFGSARSINRRYIADRFSLRQRTAASAAFVTAGSLGLSAGPALAALLEFTVKDRQPRELVNDDVVIKDDTNLYWQVENAPGCIMFILWTFYLVALLLFFQDPPRRRARRKLKDLEEANLQEQELQGASTPGQQQVVLRIAWKPEYLTQESATSDMTMSMYPKLMSCYYEYIAVFVVIAVYFVLKLVLESTLSSTSMISSFYFGWNGKIIGFYLSILGLLLLPANWLVGYMSSYYDDRELVLAIQACMLVGCIAMLDYPALGRERSGEDDDSPSYSIFQYLLASVVLFVSTNALEGPNMSLLSKTIPKSWSDGFFNVGLLATEAGTFGRALADVFLAAIGASGGMELVLNRIFGMLAGFSVASLAFTYHYYPFLVPTPEHDD
ncbi:hypothetical protein ACA910_002275 [Epithemia clementina (nom. ined.)]